jgi:hypothetical protein
MERPFSVPILFVIFNRPETEQIVFNEIKKIKPQKLFVTADGPREGKKGEKEKCEAARKIIDQIDWNCEVYKNYSDVNLGCKRGVSSGIDWFFKNVEQGIILEDDCLPNPTFFRFCEEILDRYRDDDRIGMVSGDNFQFGKIKNDYSYYFSRYSHIWGWATWRRAWRAYDVNMALWPEVKGKKALSAVFNRDRDMLYWSLIFDDVYRGKVDAWDYQWSFTCFINSYLAVMPSRNLISNIGIGGVGATHTKNKSKFADMKIQELEFPLRHPGFVLRDAESDKIVQSDNYPFWRFIASRTLKKIKKMLS